MVDLLGEVDKLGHGFAPIGDFAAHDTRLEGIRGGAGLAAGPETACAASLHGPGLEVEEGCRRWGRMGLSPLSLVRKWASATEHNWSG